MNSDRVICKNNGAVSETVQQPGSSIHENEKKLKMITDDKEPGNDESMELIDLVVTDCPTNSLIEISEGNDNMIEKKKGLDNTGAVSSPSLIERNELNDVEFWTVGQRNFPKSEETVEETTMKREETMRGDEKTMEKTELGAAVTSLSVIALAYDNSDSESEQVERTYVEKNPENLSNEMEIQITREYRTIEATSDKDSDGDNCSSANLSSDVESNESDCTENDYKKSIDRKKKNEKNNGSRYTASREKESKSEFDDLPPIEELKISVPEVLCDPLGEVAWTVERMVVVRPKPGKPTLNLDTILFVERGQRVLGRIFDVFGQVSDPHYCVRFNSTEHIKESDIKVGMIAYFCPNTEYTSVVFLQDLLKMKATDELGDDEHPEFSDDEEEQAYYAALKQKQKSEKAKTGEEVPQKRQRTDPGWKSNHPWSGGKKQERSKKPEKTYNAPGWPGGTQQGQRNPTNLWQQYPPAYPNISWPPASESYRNRDAWPPRCPPQNPYGCSEPFGNQHPPGNSRPFFLSPHSFQPGSVPYTQSGPYSQQSNPPRYPGVNFPWQSPEPRQPALSWRFPLPPPPPPPPPPPGI